MNGVSYGGYVAGMMLSETSANHSSLLKCGVAVCPVVDWRYYGTYLGSELPNLLRNIPTFKTSFLVVANLLHPLPKK